jgi:hypothetical protein
MIVKTDNIHFPRPTDMVVLAGGYHTFFEYTEDGDWVVSDDPIGRDIFNSWAEDYELVYGQRPTTPPNLVETS